MDQRTTSERFWRWAVDRCNERLREAYMRRMRHDRRCPRCLTWLSETNGAAHVEDTPDGMFELLTCAGCGHVAKWDCRGMLPVLRNPIEWPS